MRQRDPKHISAQISDEHRNPIIYLDVTEYLDDHVEVKIEPVESRIHIKVGSMEKVTLPHDFTTLAEAYKRWQKSDNAEDYDRFVRLCEKMLV